VLLTLQRGPHRATRRALVSWISYAQQFPRDDRPAGGLGPGTLAVNGCDDRSMSTPDPDEFSRAWLAAFNAHDLEAVLDHFHDDVVFTSPVAARALPGSGGVVRGKQALRAYWMLTLERVPDLRFELLGVYVGVDTSSSATATRPVDWSARC